MATDFFQRQADARRSTLWLVSMFLLSAATIVCVVVGVAWVIVEAQLRVPDPSAAKQQSQLAIPAIAGVITIVIIFGGTLFKVFELRHGGGTRVAEGLGGKRVYPNTTDPVQRRLMNIVEEMALASGTPVPPVFLLEEEGINAFAAGYSPSDAVLGVTRGCAEQLTRDQLQGVIAHEFSHMLNGDMRMSIRLIGILHGILLIGLAGHLILRTFFYTGRGRSRSDGKGAGQVIIVILVIGITAIVLGSIGSFLGNLIKAAVSRQREYLADASAVQFTRSPSGIANALKRIGGAAAGSRLQAANATEASHMFFAQGVWEGFAGLWATHPPLPKRILAIEPTWNGQFLSAPAGAATISGDQAVGFAGGGPAQASVDEVPVAIVDHAVEQVGHPTTEHRHYAAEVLKRMPTILLENVREPYGARAVVYGLLLDRQPAIRETQLQVLSKRAAPDVVALVFKLQETIDALDVRGRLPLVDLALPALRSMCQEQYAEFRDCFTALARADEQMSLFEWTLSRIVIRHLQPQFGSVRNPRIHYYSLNRLGPECSVLLSVVAAAAGPEETAAHAFRRGAQLLPELSLVQHPSSDDALDQLRDVLAKLDQVSAKHRGRIVDACAGAICADEHVTWQEAELLRGISDLLDCPMPPLLVQS